MLKNFKQFLGEYKVASVAVAFVMGRAVDDLVGSFVDNILMPLIDPLISIGGWQEATLDIGSVSMHWGSFVSSFVHFIILAFIVYFFIKNILKEE